MKTLTIASSLRSEHCYGHTSSFVVDASALGCSFEVRDPTDEIKRQCV